LWPTPTTDRATYATRRGKVYETLPGAVRLWPTPTAASYGSSNNGSPRDGRREAYATKGRPSLAAEVKLWPTPVSRDAKGRTGWIDPDRHHGMPDVAGWPLNPAWVECLMSFPVGWTELPPGEVPTKKRGNLRARSPASPPDPLASEPSATRSRRSRRTRSDG
jgi:hypothetical protein